MLSHIQRELLACDFDIKELEIFLSEGTELYLRKKKLQRAILAHPQMKKTPLYYSMTRDHKMEFVIKQTAAFHSEVFPSLGYPTLISNDLVTMQPSLMGVWPFSTHFGMFVVQIEALGTKQQTDYWLPKSRTLHVTGCYAQTEIAHGSDVQGIETTATYSMESDQFVIHTPSPQAAKFWPGDMSKLATHAVVIARLVVKGKDYGPQSFVVPLRDPKTGMPAKGVELGDVGSKYGYQNKDNGYAIFSSYRVPRSALLAKYISVSREGDVTTQGDLKIGYFAMMFIRIYILQEAPFFLAKPLAIALRYSAYRKQFKTAQDGSERVILDYQNQQYRLIPFLASAYAYFFAYRNAKSAFSQTQAQVKAGDMSGLGALHRLLSAFKPFITWNVLKGCEECRQACGGYGYLDFAGISQEVGDYAVRCTFEGQNGLMTQVVGRGLLKQLQNALTGKKLDQTAKYLAQMEELLSLKSKIEKEKDWREEAIYEALKVRAASSVSSMGNSVQDLMSEEKSPIAIFSELVQSDLMKMSQNHSEFIIFEAFKKEIEEADHKRELERKTLIQLRGLLKIYGLKCLSESMSSLFSIGYLAPHQVGTVEQALKREIGSVRKVAIGLIEAMAPPDEFIFSAIGSKSKDPYLTLLEWARKYNPMNKRDLRPGYEKYISPFQRPKL